ncbi:uncharacterized protein ACNLHF_001479 [Anomaloglossus baeobatrachus]
MKVATIFMVSAVLILFYCLTTQARHGSGKRHGKSGIAKRPEQGDSPGTFQSGKKTVMCICDQKKGHNLSRKKRHMREHHKIGGHHSPGCARVCMRKGRHGGSVRSIPLT